MESLLSTYASSDDEEYQAPPAPTTLKPPQQQPPSPPASSYLFSKLPEASSKPSPSLFSSLPTPQSKSTPLFSIPPPPPPIPKPKRVIQFHPPQFTKPPTLLDDDDDDDGDDEEDQEDKDRKKVGHLGGGGNDNINTCVKSSLLSSLPAPKNSAFPTLGSSSISNSNSSSARRSLIDVAPLHLPPPPPPAPLPVHPSHVQDPGLYDSNVNTSHVDAMGYGNYGGYGEHQYYYDEGNTWNDNAIAIAAASHSGGGGGKRRRDQPPAEILEVKQDELMKNRPTEDKSRLTGMTFGPSYQPASSKGKPSKLHKRKHQISSLYFDMKEKASELNERRAKGFLTKAETHAKYGW